MKFPNINLFFLYVKARSRIILLFTCYLLILFFVYGLYHLPWGPAFYTSLLFLSASLLITIWDCRKYYQKLKELRILKKQAFLQLGELPLAFDPIEKEYQQIITALEKRCLDCEERFRKKSADTASYYTLWTHQIKTPLSAIRLLLQENEINLSALEQELFKTEQYVEMVLQYQRLDQNSHDLILQEYSLDFLVKQAIKKTSTLFIHKGIHLDLHPITKQIITDEKWMVFVLEQLLTNAVKYTPKGSVSIYEGTSMKATLIIEDTGIGIRSEDIPRVFDWGYTGYNGRLDKRSTGIGLSLCKQALTLLGHSIDISSKLGKGTKVALTLSREHFDIE